MILDSKDQFLMNKTIVLVQYMFGVIVLLYISLPNCPKICTIYSMAYRERFSVITGDHKVCKSGHL